MDLSIMSERLLDLYMDDLIYKIGKYEYFITEIKDDMDLQMKVNQVIFQKLEGEYLFQKAIRNLSNKQQYILAYGK